MFVTHLAQQSLIHQSIKVYLLSVRNLHVSAGLHEEFSKQLTLVLKGITEEKAKAASLAVGLPVTIEIMRSTRAVLESNAAQYVTALLWAACYMTFFGFLRCGESTVPSQTSQTVIPTCTSP